MLKFPPELLVHKGNVYYLLYVAGGLLMTVAAGGQCVDVAVRTAQNPSNLLRLSNTLIGFMGLRYQIHTVTTNSVAKGKLKRLFFTDSFNSLLDMTRPTLQGTHHFKVSGWFPETQRHLDSANCISAKRCSIYYILICGVSLRPVLILRLGDNKLKTHSPSNQLQWLINFSNKSRARGDVVFLFLGGQISTGSSDTNDDSRPPSLTLVLSALSVVLMWMFLPHIVVFAVICLALKVKQLIH